MTDPCTPWRELLPCEGIVGRSRALADVLESIAAVAPTRRSVLLLGPTGTGKSELARVVHLASARADRPWVRVQCSSLAEGIVEHDLFGAERGAFTGADRRTDGVLRAAHGTTLFLEEVGELSPSAQARLLVFLDDGSVRRLGGRGEERVDVRIVAATNRDLEHDPGFRRDLYHRLAAWPIRVPSLAERPEDVPVLASALAARAARDEGRPALPLTREAVASLLARSWPGNVRELERVVTQGLVRAWADAAPAVDVRHLRLSAPPLPAAAGVVALREAFEAWLVDEALREAHGNMSEAARRLGVSRSWLYDLRGPRLRTRAA